MLFFVVLFTKGVLCHWGMKPVPWVPSFPDRTKCHPAYLLEKLIIRRGGSSSWAVRTPEPMSEGFVIGVIGHYCSAVEIGRENKVDGLHPLDHRPGLRLHLWQTRGEPGEEAERELPHVCWTNSVRKRRQKKAKSLPVGEVWLGNFNLWNAGYKN